MYKQKITILLLLLCSSLSLLAQKEQLAKDRQGDAMEFEDCQVEYCEAHAGEDRIICEGTLIALRAREICPNHLYRWINGDTGDYLGSGTRITVHLFVTTLFILEVVAPGDEIVTRDEVKMTVLINTSYPTDISQVSDNELSIKRVPPEPDGIAEFQMSNPDIWGFTYPETYNMLFEIEVDLCSDGDNWRPILKNVVGPYSIQYRLVPGVQEVTGVGGNTSENNHCIQVENMDNISKRIVPFLPMNWYILEAVQKHEEVHEEKLLPSLLQTVVTQEASIEAVITYIEDTGQSLETAKQQWQDKNYAASASKLYLTWTVAVTTAAANDHSPGGLTEQAERAVVVPIIKDICCHAKDEGWTNCVYCSSFTTDCR
jgi:hypothetical protein